MKGILVAASVAAGLLLAACGGTSSATTTPATGREIIHEIVRNMREGVEPLAYTALAPAIYNVYLHPDDFDRLRGILPRIARRGVESRERLGRHRWVVERTLAWLNRFRRLTVRYERRADLHQAFLSIGCALICWHFLREWVAG